MRLQAAQALAAKEEAQQAVLAERLRREAAERRAQQVQEDLGRRHPPAAGGGGPGGGSQGSGSEGGCREVCGMFMSGAVVLKLPGGVAAQGWRQRKSCCCFVLSRWLSHPKQRCPRPLLLQGR